MYGLVVLSVVAALCFGDGVLAKREPKKRQVTVDSIPMFECFTALARLRIECGLSDLVDVTSAANLYTALRASCASQSCGDAVVDALVACNPTNGMSLDDARMVQSNIMSFYCKQHPSGSTCGAMLLEASDLMSLDTMGCGLMVPPRVPETCSPMCTQLMQVLAQTYGCCWTEFVKFSQRLLPQFELLPNATELWSRCRVESPGFCGSAQTSGNGGGVEIDSNLSSGQIGSVHGFRGFALGVSTVLSVILACCVRMFF